MKDRVSLHLRPVCLPYDTAGQRGAALIIVALIALALSVLGLAVLQMTATDSAISANEVTGVRTFNVAEAGIEHAKLALIGEETDALLQAGGLLLDAVSLAGGTYTVTVGNNLAPDFPKHGLAADAGGATHDTDGYIVLTSVGNLDTGRRAVQVILQVTEVPSGGGIFDYAAYGRDKWDLSNGAVHGNVRSNSKIGNNRSIYGDATAGTTVNDPGLVSGTVTEYAPPIVYPDLPCPALPWGPAPTGPSVTLNGSGELSISGGPTVFAAGTYFFSKFSKSGGGDIVINPGDQVDIWVSGQFSSTGGGWTNSGGHAADLQVWSCGGNTKDFSFTGDNVSTLTIYAPLSKVAVTGGGDKYGAFIGREWKNTGSANIYYDTNLAAGSAGIDSVTFVKGTWTERAL